MRTITKTYELYPIAELSAEALEKAHHNWLINSDYHYNADNRNTLDKFCELFEIDCYNWSYDECTHSFSFKMKQDEEIQQMTGVRLATYIINNYGHALYTSKTYYSKDYKKKRKSRVFKNDSCVLTGYYLDDVIVQSITDFIKAPDYNTSFRTLIRRCLDKFFKACSEDVSACQSQEYFKDESEANEWEYLSNGTYFS